MVNERVKLLTWVSGTGTTGLYHSLNVPIVSGAALTAYASGTSSHTINGEIKAIQIDWTSGTNPGYLVITSEEPSDTILAVYNTSGTDRIYYPRNITCNNAGSQAVAADYWENFVVKGNVYCNIGSVNDTTIADVRVYYC